MKLSIEILKERSEYWKKEIGSSGIWKPELFKPVRFIIRKNHRRYNALFQRKRKKGMTEWEDSIVVYNKVEDFDPIYLDSLIVHEMIHQYLVQNNLNGKRPHGLPFKTLMSQINREFEGRLNIQLKSSHPSNEKVGEGETIHQLIFVEDERNFYCCVIHPKKIKEIESLAARYRKLKRIRKFYRAQSNNIFFNNSSRCVKRLSGIKKPLNQLPDFLHQYSVKLLNLEQ